LRTDGRCDGIGGSGGGDGEDRICGVGTLGDSFGASCLTTFFFLLPPLPISTFSILFDQ
jgi:hypothetical protein